jgi:hypothetical protein
MYMCRPEKMGADWRKPRILVDTSTPCQTQSASTGFWIKKRGSVSRAKSTPKEEGGGDKAESQTREASAISMNAVCPKQAAKSTNLLLRTTTNMII